MRRGLAVLIVAFWLVMLAVLVRRTWPAPAPAVLAPPSGAVAGEEWLSVYHGDQKVGYTHQRLRATADGFTFDDDSLLRLTMLHTAQTVRTRLRSRTGKDLALREVEFELSSGVGTLQARGVVDGKTLRLTLQTGKETSEQTLPLTEPIYLPATLLASLNGRPLAPGQRFERLIFDPTTLHNDRLHVTVERREVVPGSSPGVEGWKVRETFRQLRTTAWIDEHGAVLREEGPMGLVLVRQTAAQALHQGWSAATALDLVASVAVPVARPIAHPRQRVALRLRLSGIDVSQVPSDADQLRHGAELTITRPALASLRSYPLPYRGTRWAAELADTPFLQIHHARVAAAAQAAVGGERDALRAAVRLNDWVYAHLRQVPTLSIPNALQVLDMGQGDCNEHAVLFAALSRAVGLPARLVAGAVYLRGAFYYHEWCEVWLGRWVAVDPTWHEFPADVTHIKFVVGGPAEQTAMLGVIGRLGIEVLDDAPPSR